MRNRPLSCLLVALTVLPAGVAAAAPTPEALHAQGCLGRLRVDVVPGQYDAESDDWVIDGFVIESTVPDPVSSTCRGLVLWGMAEVGHGDEVRRTEPLLVGDGTPNRITLLLEEGRPVHVRDAIALTLEAGTPRPTQTGVGPPLAQAPVDPVDPTGSPTGVVDPPGPRAGEESDEVPPGAEPVDDEAQLPPEASPDVLGETLDRAEPEGPAVLGATGADAIGLLLSGLGTIGVGVALGRRRRAWRS